MGHSLPTPELYHTEIGYVTGNSLGEMSSPTQAAINNPYFTSQG